MNQSRAENSVQAGLPAFVWWATTLAWTVTIYQLSTGTFAARFTEWMLREALGLLGITMSPASFDLLHHLVRKLAHLTEYGIYALLLYGSFGGGKDFAWHGRRAAWCAGIAAAYSLIDELHQFFVPERGGSLLDSALDTTGAALAMAGLYVVHRALQANRSRNAARKANAAETWNGAAGE